jgi:hypothetical protein
MSLVPNRKLSKEQWDVMLKIIDYGEAHGFTQQEIEIAIKTAWIESKLGADLGPNPQSTASGLFQYTDGNWNTYHNDDGTKNNFDNQIKAFYEDLSNYRTWYNDPVKGQNIPKDKIDFGEYVYIKHHDGPNYDKFQNAPGEDIWNRVNFELFFFPEEPLLQCHQSFTTATTAVVPRRDPLVLDLDGDGVETVSASNGAYFDHDGNGFAERSGWVSSDDGLLVFDKNGDGIVNDGKELFGDQTILEDGTKASHGFQALTDLDDNQDGKIDANDAAFSQWMNHRNLPDFTASYTT